jgi:hypothetical protein
MTGSGVRQEEDRRETTVEVSKPMRRCQNRGHNTLTIDAQNQDLDAKASLARVGAMGNSIYAVANLNQAYKDNSLHGAVALPF